MAHPERLRQIASEVIRESELPRTLIAKDAELGRATLEAWLSGLRNPSPESLALIADGLERRGETLKQLAARIRSSLADPA